MKDNITERKDCFHCWKKEKYGKKKKTNNTDPANKEAGALAMAGVSEQVTDILKRALTQQNEEISKKFSQLEQKMNARDSGVTNLGAVGIEGKRMTGNDFMLSAMETPKSQVSVPQWFEADKPALIDHLENFEEESAEESSSLGVASAAAKNYSPGWSTLHSSNMR